MEWNPPQKIERKQSILNLFCDYSTFTLILSYFPKDMAIACTISRKYMKQTISPLS